MGRGLGGSPPLPEKLACPPMFPPTVLTPKCRFHAVFDHFAQIVPPHQSTPFGKYEWEYEEWDGNAGAENQRENPGNLGGNAENVGNQVGDARNQCGNLSIAIERTCHTNENDKLKDWREVKIISLVSRI